MITKSLPARLALAMIIALPFGAAVSGDVNPLAPYPSPAERDREVYELAAAWPDRVEVTEYGKSVEGRPLLVMHVHRPGSEEKPAAWIAGDIHGNEWIGNRMAMGVARLVLEGDGKDELITGAMDRMDFYFVPCINPDGYEKTWEAPDSIGKIPNSGATIGSGEDTSGWAHTRKNAHGVDLNRNFPMPGKPLVPIDWAGSPDPKSVHYRGPAPLSEPETAAIDKFFKEHDEIVAAISWHSFAGVQYPAHCPSHACMKRFKRVCRAFRDNQGAVKYPRLSSRVFDSYTGEMEDWLYAEYGVLAMDVEISDKKHNQAACDCDDLFWLFNPKDPGVWIENDARAAVAAMLEAVKITGGVRIPKDKR